MYTGEDFVRIVSRIKIAENSAVLCRYILNVVVADGHVPKRERSVFFLRVD